jgi:hypothetical protein
MTPRALYIWGFVARASMVLPDKSLRSELETSVGEIV